LAKFDYDIGVIGGGAAGLTVSSGAARLGAKTLLVEREDKLGGDCLHYGCVPSKTLIKTAHVYHQINNSTKFGLPQAAIAAVDFKEIAARIKSVIEVIQVHDSVERFCKLGVQVEFGQAEFTDEHTIRLNGRRYSAKFWVIATGSSPAIPKLPGLETTAFLTNKDIFSLNKLPSAMAILGAGPIAIEMAQAFCRLGTEVHVIQRSGQILSKEDKDVANLAMEALANEGVSFHLHSAVNEIHELGPGKEIHLSGADGKKSTLVVAELLVALGRSPNVENLGLERIGLDYGPKGIIVDNRLRTNHKHIFAAGDVNGSFMFTHAAGYEGGIVISNAVFRLPRKANYTYLPWCTYTHPEIASVGLNEKAAAAKGISYTVWTENFADNDRALAEGEQSGKIKMLLNDKEKPIGVQIIGPHAGDILSEWIAVLNGNVKLATLASAVHPYPTLAEINKRVAGSYFSGKIFSETVKKGLKLFFNLIGGTGENPCTKL
jgi:pyruvate/2-oxoglutarate dehydrogenase complex dihydrolipoamide dehydrogenase (E3) component